MIGATNWEDANSRYLSAALNWLRLRLERLADSHQIGHASVKHPLKAAGASEAGSDSIALAASDLSSLEELEPASGLVVLSRLFQLSQFERNVLLLCVGVELDTRVASLCARAQDDPGRTYPTFALAMTLFDDPAWDVVSPERPLRYWRLVDVNSSSGQALTTSRLRVDERIVNFVKGLNYLDERLSPLMTPLDCPYDEMPPSQQKLVDEISERLKQAAGPLMPLVQLLGPDASGKQAVACRAGEAFGRRVYCLTEGMLPGPQADLDGLIRLWDRESLLLPLALYFDTQESDITGEAAGLMPLRRFMARANGVLFLGSRELWPRLGRASFSIDVEKPNATEQQTEWAQDLGGDAGDNPARLAGQFNLNLGAIRQIAASARNATTTDGDLSTRLWDACRASVRPRLDSLAHRIDAKATWNEIVLPKPETELLQQIAAQVSARGQVYGEWGFGEKMNRGLGISALFAGDSGTGKTMAAEVIANELRLNLYRIDLSAVMSKYIGETAKNLCRLFDAADDGGAILFFDEADALFGKRSEVKDSHDRYANIEINYLLQRVESYRGLAILATNAKSALDSAFVRRLRFIVNFSFPWRK